MVALVSGDSIDPQRLIYLGADEVLRSNINEAGDWIEMISDLVRSANKLRLVIFPSNIISNVIMGAVYSRTRDKIAYYLDEGDHADETAVAKSFDSTGFALQRNSKEGTLGLVSLKVASIPPPLEDNSRYGKIGDLQVKESNIPILLDAPEVPLNSSSELTILVGSNEDRIKELARKLADKYQSRILNYSGEIQVVYGPCIAIDLRDRVKDLPEFKGDLISLNAKNSPISAISDVVVISSEIGKILENLL